MMNSVPNNIPPAEMNDRPIRFEDLVERCMGNIDLATRLLNQSQDLLVDDLQTLQLCDASEEPNEVARLAHRLKGATANVGAYALSDVLARIEQHGRTGQTETVPGCLLELDSEWTRFTECVVDICGQK